MPTEDSSDISQLPLKEISSILNDRIFVKHKDRMVKILFEDILFIEAIRNYSKIITNQGEYLLSITLKKIEEKLPETVFLRIHRSYLVNILLIEEVSDNRVFIGEHEVPMSGVLRDNLMQRITKI